MHYEIDPADLTTAEAREAAGAYNRGQLRPDTLDKRKHDMAVEEAAPAASSVPLYPPQVGLLLIVREFGYWCSTLSWPNRNRCCMLLTWVQFSPAVDKV